MSLQEVQAEVAKLGQSVAAHQQAAEERIKALESNKGVAEIEGTLKKINASIVEHKDRLDKTEEGIKVQLDKLEENQKASKASTDEIERKVNQLHAGALAGGSDEQKKLRENAAKFFAAKNRGEMPDPASVNIEEYQAYRKGFAAYFRKGEINNSMSVGSDSEGGFLVPTEVSSEAIVKLYLSSPIRSIASVMTIGSDAIEIPIDATRAASGWVGETGTRSETSTPTVGKKRIEVFEQYAAPKVTQKFLDDASIDVEAWLADKISMEFAMTEATAFVTGNGVNKPHGFLDYGSSSVTTGDATRAFDKLQYVPTGASGDFNTISGLVADDANCFHNIVAALHPRLRPGAVWIMNRITAAAVRGLRDAQGRWLWEQSMQAGQPSSLFGYPVIEAEDMPDIAANSYSIAFGNFKEGYQIVNRLGIRTIRDPLTSKGWVIFYSTMRVGADIASTQAIKLLKFAAS